MTKITLDKIQTTHELLPGTQLLQLKLNYFEVTLSLQL